MTDPQYRVARRQPGQLHVDAVWSEQADFHLQRWVKARTGGQLRPLVITVIQGFWRIT